MWIGGNRFSHCGWIRYDEVLKQILGWKQKGIQSKEEGQTIAASDNRIYHTIEIRSKWLAKIRKHIIGK